MQIIDNRKIYVTVGELSNGSTFRHYGDTFIKTNEIVNGEYACVSLTTGIVKDFSGDCEIAPIKAKVVIES